MLHAIASAFIGAVAFISSLFGVGPITPAYHAEVSSLATTTGPTLGAALPSGTAVFETSLQSRISSTDTSLTLVANSVRGGSSLSGFQCFTVDEGRTDAEYICGTVSGTSVTSLTRGIDPSTGTTSNSSLKFAHRVGADVKITDFPVLQILRNQANGADTYPNVLHYASGVTPASGGDLTDYEFVVGLAFNGAGVIDATANAKGVVELATAAEAAASTAQGSSGILALPASLATSTYNSATAANVIPVTGVSGKIDSAFIATSSLYSGQTFSVGAITASAVSNIASSTLYATTSTGTWTKPANLKYLKVTIAGGGGDVGSGTKGGAGGGGALCLRTIPAAAVPSTVTVTVGAAGSASAGGTSSFGSLGTATGGNRGTADPASGGTTAGASGGTATGCDINVSGEDSGTQSRTADFSVPGGRPLLWTYGRGASGAGVTGAVGATQGVVVIESFFF
jgi:hypothetical protein